MRCAFTIFQDLSMNSVWLNHVYRLLLRFFRKFLQIIKVNFFIKCRQNVTKTCKLGDFLSLTLVKIFRSFVAKISSNFTKFGESVPTLRFRLTSTFKKIITVLTLFPLNAITCSHLGMTHSSIFLKHMI